LETTLDSLKIGQKAKITEVNLDEIPLKLIEMGCLPDNEVTLLQIAPFGDPMYFIINDTHVSIRKETAKHIQIKCN
jgi:ferrous iron transport protein A